MQFCSAGEKCGGKSLLIVNDIAERVIHESNYGATLLLDPSTMNLYSLIKAAL